MSICGFLLLRPSGVRRSLLVAALVGWAFGVVLAQEAPIAFTGGQILTLNGERFDPGTLVIQHGRIVSVGPSDSPLPPEASVRDFSGQLILPGLVDTHSHIGSAALGDPSGPIQPDLRILDSIDVRHPSLRRAVAGGITTVNVMPGSGLLVGGQTLYLKLREGTIIDDLLLTNATGAWRVGSRWPTAPIRNAILLFPAHEERRLRLSARDSSQRRNTATKSRERKGMLRSCPPAIWRWKHWPRFSLVNE
jgi:hypothetical protein